MGGVEALLQVLHDYESASSQKINYQKSLVFFSKYMSIDSKVEILAKLGMVGNEGTGSYLGMPYNIGRSKKQIFSFFYQ